MNIENIKRVLDHIDANPTSWDQSTWHSACGSTHCFMGWAQLLSVRPANNDSAHKDARIFLDMSYSEADYYSSTLRTIEDLRKAIDYDRHGYDQDGYDRDGHNRNGHNRSRKI